MIIYINCNNSNYHFADSIILEMSVCLYSLDYHPYLIFELQVISLTG